MPLCGDPPRMPVASPGALGVVAGMAEGESPSCLQFQAQQGLVTALMDAVAGFDVAAPMVRLEGLRQIAFGGGCVHKVSERFDSTRKRRKHGFDPFEYLMEENKEEEEDRQHDDVDSPFTLGGGLGRKDSVGRLHKPRKRRKGGRGALVRSPRGPALPSMARSSENGFRRRCTTWMTCSRC